MSLLRCHQQGCQQNLVYEHPHKEVVHSYAVCMQCRQEVLCVEHLQLRAQQQQGRCRSCRRTQWSLQLLPNTRLSPQLQAFIIQNQGQVRVIENAVPATARGGRVANAYERGRSTKVKQNQPPRARQSRQITPTPVASLQVAARNSHERHYHNLDSFTPDTNFDAYAQADHSHYQQSQATASGPRVSVPPPTSPRQHSSESNVPVVNSRNEPQKAYPKVWRLITGSDLPRDAQGLTHGVAIARESDTRILMMDDDRIIRNLEIEGDIISITQSPRKRRLIIERELYGVKELVWLNSKEIQGFITNPLDTELSVFGAHFTHDNRFVYISERFDGRFDLREGTFTKGRGIQSRLLGSSIKGVPLTPVCSHRSQRVFFFKEVSEAGYVPVCRRLSDGDDRIMGELCEKPVTLHASRNADTIAWIDHQGYVWGCTESQEALRLGRTDQVNLLAVAQDGHEIAWVNQGALHCYHMTQQQVSHWPVKDHILAIGWRSEIF